MTHDAWFIAAVAFAASLLVLGGVMFRLFLGDARRRAAIAGVRVSRQPRTVRNPSLQGARFDAAGWHGARR
ncbi:hypothetical protein ACMGDM_13855 [Sphingomonas sp. DT-51]